MPFETNNHIGIDGNADLSSPPSKLRLGLLEAPFTNRKQPQRHPFLGIRGPMESREAK